MVKIRLKRTGKKNAPCYRIVVADARSKRDGKNIETIGYYNPRENVEKVDVERADYWISNGAQPSSTVSDLIRRAKTGEEKVEGKTKMRADKKAAAEAEAKAQAEAEAKAAAEEAAATEAADAE